MGWGECGRADGRGWQGWVGAPSSTAQLGFSLLLGSRCAHCRLIDGVGVFPGARQCHRDHHVMLYWRLLLRGYVSLLPGRLHDAVRSRCDTGCTSHACLLAGPPVQPPAHGCPSLQGPGCCALQEPSAKQCLRANHPAPGPRLVAANHTPTDVPTSGGAPPSASLSRETLLVCNLSNWPSSLRSIE